MSLTCELLEVKLGHRGSRRRHRRGNLLWIRRAASKSQQRQRSRPAEGERAQSERENERLRDREGSLLERSGDRLASFNPGANGRPPPPFSSLSLHQWIPFCFCASSS